MFLLNCKFKMIVYVIVAIMGYFFNSNFIFQASTVINLQILKCPFCFGETFCHALEKVDIEITPLQFILEKVDKKSVFYGTFENNSIVLKKLGTVSQRFILEESIAELFDHQFDYYNFKFQEEARRFYYESLILLNASFHDPSYKLKWCPTLNGVSTFFEPIIRKNFDDTLAVNIWTSLIINPEPLILQIFEAENGWPVPKYLGSCGAAIFVEYCGKTLYHYYNHPWLLRVHIAEQLLQIAHAFTFKSTKIAVYLRDWSYDNVALDSELLVRVIDLEHIILVDKSTTKDMPLTWKQEHSSEHFECEECIAYSPMIICDHHISDHNFYAVCKEFFHSEHTNDFGILHSLPNNTKHDEKIRLVKYYAEECVHPSRNQSRFEIARKLKELLFELKIDEDFSIEETKKLI